MLIYRLSRPWCVRSFLPILFSSVVSLLRELLEPRLILCLVHTPWLWAQVNLTPEQPRQEVELGVLKVQAPGLLLWPLREGVEIPHSRHEMPWVVGVIGVLPHRLDDALQVLLVYRILLLCLFAVLLYRSLSMLIHTLEQTPEDPLHRAFW